MRLSEVVGRIVERDPTGSRDVVAKVAAHQKTTPAGENEPT